MSDWGAAVRETHSAVVLLMGERAYKIKKPVDLGFLDFRTRQSREQACRRELLLNRRMAPDVYEGVADVIAPDGQPCEHVLVMRRMPEERRLSTLVRQGADVRDLLRRLARSLAAFHASARTNAEIAENGGAAHLRRRWADNIATLRSLAGILSTPVDPSVINRIEELALGYVAGRAPLLQSRVSAGLVRDGHGDLLADDIFCLPDGPRALDCLDFDDHLRWMDVLDDVACLAMDLERLGSPDSGAVLVQSYTEFSGCHQPDSLRHHYIAYRAVMRAKVAAIRAHERGVGDAQDAAEASLLCAIGLRHLEAGQVRLVLVGGAPASGKTTLANALGDVLPAAVLSSDRVRKELRGLSPAQHAPAGLGKGIYTPESTTQTYAWLGTRARSLLAMGESVIVDASFTDAALRAPFRQVAVDASAHLVELHCQASAATRDARLRRRETIPDPLSDAGLAIGHHLLERADHWPQAVDVATEGPPSDALSLALHTVNEATQPQPAGTRTGSAGVDQDVKGHDA